METAICATTSGMDSCKAASEKPEQVGASGYWFRDRISQGQGLSCGKHNRTAKTVSSPDEIGLARAVSMLKQGFCCLTLLSLVVSPVVLQWCVILIFLSKVNDGCTEMPSPAERAICCPRTDNSTSPRLPHGHIQRLDLAHRESHVIYQKLHRSGLCIGDLDYLCLLLLKVNLIWPVEDRISEKQPSLSFMLLHVHFFLFFLNEVITMTITTQLGQAKMQWVVLCEGSRRPVQEWLLADWQSPFPRMCGGSHIPWGLPGDLQAGFSVGRWVGSVTGVLRVRHPTEGNVDKSAWDTLLQTPLWCSSSWHFVLFSWVKICHSW